MLILPIHKAFWFRPVFWVVSGLHFLFFVSCQSTMTFKKCQTELSVVLVSFCCAVF